MKRAYALTLMICILLTTVFLGQITAFSDELVPNDWELIAADDFTAEDGTIFSDYTGGTGFASKWTADLANTSYTFTPDAYINNGQYYTSNKNQTTNAYRRMDSSIDLTADADYYVMFDMYSWAGGNNSTVQRLIFRDSENPNYAIYFGTSYSQEFGCNLPVVGAQSSENFVRNMKIPANGIYTFVVQISARSTGYDSLKVRVFTDSAAEEPSFAPQYWDEEYWLNNRPWANLDTVQITAGNGSGSTYNPRLDNFKLYKTAPVFVTADISPQSRHLSHGVTLTITAPSDNILGNPQVIDSITWYDATDFENPIQIATGESFFISEDMKDKILRTEVVITDTITQMQTTYYPVSRLVHEIFEVMHQTVTSNSGRTGKINYTDFSKNTTLYFNAYITRARGVSGGSAQLIVAQYSSNAMLKRVAFATPRKINDITVNQTLLLQTSMALDHGTIDPATKNYEAGDYFKTFVWYSNNQVFAFDLLKPMHLYKGNQIESLVVIP